ncbi:MAG: hypothetical protein ABWZ15_04155 [Acidimicrobiia bacterium]
MNARLRLGTAASISVLFAITGIAACGGSDDDSPAAAASPGTTSQATSAPAPTADEAGWQDEVAATCDALIAALESVPAPEPTPEGLTTQIAAIQAAVADLPRFDEVTVPADVQDDWDHILTVVADAGASLEAAAAESAAGDPLAAEAALGRAGDGVNRTYGLIALAGAECGDATPERAATAALNIPTEGDVAQIASGFGSIWGSAELGGRVIRVDPESGEIIATIDVGAGPLKLQPADDRMWVRTRDEFVAIDPETNTVVARLAKADVGPAVNRNWAVDGAMWICDGQRLHRYDPTTLQPVTTIELGIECGQPYATDELVVAWNHNDDDGESGLSEAVLVDPATNTAGQKITLPVDVLAPVVLDDAVFFPGNRGDGTAVVVDRATATVTATPDLGPPTSGSLSVSDGERIFVPTLDEKGILVVDASTFEVIDTVNALGANSVALLDGSLWTASRRFGLLQRHDDVAG